MEHKLLCGTLLNVTQETHSGTPAAVCQVRVPSSMITKEGKYRETEIIRVAYYNTRQGVNRIRHVLDHKKDIGKTILFSADYYTKDGYPRFTGIDYPTTWGMIRTKAIFNEGSHEELIMDVLADAVAAEVLPDSVFEAKHDAEFVHTTVDTLRTNESPFVRDLAKKLSAIYQAPLYAYLGRVAPYATGKVVSLGGSMRNGAMLYASFFDGAASRAKCVERGTETCILMRYDVSSFKQYNFKGINYYTFP